MAVPTETPPRHDALKHLLRPRSLSWEAIVGWWPWLLLSLALLIFGWFFIKPAPPDRVVLASGSKSGAYYAFAKQYAETFRQSGVQLDVQDSLGSVDNYRRLESDAAKSDENGVSLAIVQSGTCPEGLKVDLQSVASLYLEPVWIFYRQISSKGPAEPRQLPDLANRRVAVGPEGSGTRSIFQRLLALNGMTWGEAPPATAPATNSSEPTDGQEPGKATGGVVQFTDAAGQAAADALTSGNVDAAVFVLAPRHPLIRQMLESANVRMMSIDRHEAYSRLLPFLSDVKLPQGTIDLSQNLPPNDVYLLAPAANLVCRRGTHPAIVGLLIRAAIAAHERGDLLSPPGVMPSTKFVEFPVDSAAAEYFRNGPPLLQRTLPFWAAAFVDRMKILLLPLITLLIPLARVAPPLYVWRIRSRIYRWYRVLRDIDGRLRSVREGQSSPLPLSDDLQTLHEMETELSNQNVPLSYMQEFYNLRLHTDFLHRQVKEQLAAQSPDSATLSPPSVGPSSKA